MVAICFFTLLFLLFGRHCSPSQHAEQTIEQVALIIRNGIAFVRSAMLLQKNTSQYGTSRVRDIDLDSFQGVPLGFEESLRAH
jgi:hypothetical protein